MSYRARGKGRENKTSQITSNQAFHRHRKAHLERKTTRQKMRREGRKKSSQPWRTYLQTRKGCFWKRELYARTLDLNLGNHFSRPPFAPEKREQYLGGRPAQEKTRGGSDVRTRGEGRGVLGDYQANLKEVRMLATRRKNSGKGKG